MKVLIVTSFDYPHVGGLSTHVEMITEEMRKRGNEIDVVSFSDINKVYGKYFVRGVSFALNKLRRGKGIVFTNKQRCRLIRKLVDEKLSQKSYDLINAEDPAAMVALEGIKIPKVLTVHGYAAFEYLSIGSLLKDTMEEKYIIELEKKAYNMADAIVAVDTRISNYLRDFAGKEARIIRNFVDVDKFDGARFDTVKVRKKLGIPEGKTVLFCPRRLTEKNGVIYPSMAVKLLKDKYSDIVLYHAGDGEERPRIENYIRENGLEEHVKLLGGISHESIVEYFAAADIVLVPSVFSKGIEEATSIAAIEAMALSKPTIASAIGGLKELIVDGESGLLVEEKDEKALAEAIERVLSNSELRERISRGARKRVTEEFSLSSGAEKYLEVYRSVI